MEIDVDAEDIAHLLLRIEALGDAVDKQRILDEAEALLLNRNRQRFFQMVDPSGVPWPVSQASIVRETKGSGGGTLYDTGRLYRSIQAYAASGPDERRVGTDVEYGPFHQYGTKKMVQRQFLGISEEDLSLITHLIELRIENAEES